MGNFDNSNNSCQSPSTSRANVVGLSKSYRNVALHQSPVRDPLIIERINQYLNDNKDKAFIEINDMVDALRRRYREYRRRHWGQFKILVERAFKVISKKAGLDKDLEVDESSSSDIEECNPENNERNNSNSQLMNLYQTPKQPKMKTGKDDLELIDLSSDEDDGKKNQSTENLPQEHSFSEDNREDQVTMRLLRNTDVSVTRRRRPPGLTPLLRPKGWKRMEPLDFTTVTFADFGGSPKVLEEVCKLILHLKHPEVFRKLGVTAPRGFLLHGPPGCGKTLLATAIAGELGCHLIKISGPELVAGVSGESEERVRELFQSAINSAPCVLFIDEVDVISPNRQTSQREMEKRIVAQLITSFDDLAAKDERGQVLVVGATKRPEALDPALRRAGRFDREVCLGIPDEKSRFQILNVLCSQVKLAGDIDLSLIARMTPGFVGADLLSLVREAAMVAIARIFSAIEKQREEARKAESERRKRKQAIDLPPVVAKKTKKDGDEEETDLIMETNGTQEETDVSLVDGAKESEKASEENQTNDEVVGEKDGEQVVVNGVVDKPDEEASKKDEEKEKSPEPRDTVIVVENPASVENAKDDGGTKKKRKQNLEVCVEDVEVEDDEMDVVDVDLGDNFQCQCLLRGCTSCANPSLKSLLGWVRDSDYSFSNHDLSRFIILESDISSALKTVQPSAKREGFATVPDVTWDDVGSLVAIREHLKMTILGPIKYQAQFERLGLVAPAGVLLCGPPGCGKTLLAKAVANEAGINFISVKGPELLNMYVGESERAVRTVFQRARNSAPCVIFFDELDALCPRRTEGDSGSGARVVNQMLTEMDGVGERRGVFLMAATNRPDIVDPAVLRPGRLDRTVYIGMPNADDRKDILRAITKNGTKPPLESNISLPDLASREELENWTGADLAALMREAAMQAVRDATAGLTETSGETPTTDIFVTAAHIEHAIRTVRPSISQKDLKRYEEMKKQFAGNLD